MAKHTPIALRTENVESGNYFNPEIATACFALPEFAKKLTI
jgi:hypothetical protein